MPDAWETAHGLDPFNPADAVFDTDSDGLTNLQEYLAGTDPRDSTSGLKLNLAVAPGGTNLVLSFLAAAGLSYAVESETSLNGTWAVLQTIDAAPSNRTVQVPISPAGSMRVFRVRTPAEGSGGALSIASIAAVPGGGVKLALAVPANQDCTVLFAPAVFGTTWSTLTNYPAVPTNRVIQLEVPAATASGFFRLRTP
jgi:hypothetical protein